MQSRTAVSTGSFVVPNCWHILVEETRFWSFA